MAVEESGGEWRGIRSGLESETCEVFEEKKFSPCADLSQLKQRNSSSGRRSERRVTFCKRVSYLAVTRLLGELRGAPQVSRDLARFTP